MYSPKIDERLIPILYRMAKRYKMPMTRLVNAMVKHGIKECRRMEHEKRAHNRGP